MQLGTLLVQPLFSLLSGPLRDFESLLVHLLNLADFRGGHGKGLDLLLVHADLVLELLYFLQIGLALVLKVIVDGTQLLQLLDCVLVLDIESVDELGIVPGLPGIGRILGFIVEVAEVEQLGPDAAVLEEKILEAGQDLFLVLLADLVHVQFDFGGDRRIEH